MTDTKWDWVGRIETAHGHEVNILDIDADMVRLHDVASSLSKICRFNGHLPHFYSVAEHCVRVAWWLEAEGYSTDVVLTGLLHDAAEAYVGDMMRPLKRVPEMYAVFAPIENQAMVAVHKKLGGTFPHPDPVHEADHAMYLWEVDNIRSGNIRGWEPEMAEQMFIAVYKEYVEGFTTEGFTTDEDVVEIDVTLYDDSISPRRQLLMDAANLIDGDRNAQYGDPSQDFRRTAIYWSTHLGGVLRRKAHITNTPIDDDIMWLVDALVDPHDVAIMMGQLKDSRLAWDPYKQDTWADKAGYTACGYETIL